MRSSYLLLFTITLGACQAKDTRPENMNTDTSMNTATMAPQASVAMPAPAMSWFFANYLNGQEDRLNPRVNLVAADLKGLPPTTIINAQIDPLRSEGEMLARKFQAAGVTVSQKTYEGVAHEFFGMGAVVDKGMAAEQMAADALKKVF